MRSAEGYGRQADPRRATCGDSSECSLLERIARAEDEATAEVRAAAVDLAIAATRKLVESELDDERQAKLVDDAIGDLDDKLH